jgi:hypothetical protein
MGRNLRRSSNVAGSVGRKKYMNFIDSGLLYGASPSIAPTVLKLKSAGHPAPSISEVV